MPHRAITLEALEVLDAIDRQGSFAGAANILYKVPSAITYTVQKLEQDLGVSLFTKQGRQSVLTPAGRVILERGRDLLAASDRIAEAAREIDSGWESELNIAVDTVQAMRPIHQLLDTFYQTKPDLEINIFQESLIGGWEALTEGRADLAIGVPPKPSNITGFHCETYAQLRWVLAVKAGHPLTQLPQPIQQSDLENYRAIVVRDSSQNQAKLSFNIFSKQTKLTVETVDEKIAAQKAGLGVGYLPEPRIQQELANGELVALEMQGSRTRAELSIAWRRGKKSKALSWFVEQIRNGALQP